MVQGQPANEGDRDKFLAMVDAGISVAKASAAIGVSRQSGYRYKNERDGIVRRPRSPGSGRFLTVTDREEIALGLEMGLTHTQIGDLIGRDRTTIWREVKGNRNADGSYRAISAQQRNDRRARRPKPSKLVTNTELRTAVVAGLRKKWSPRQISETLVIDHPDRPEMRVSHETIYEAVYVQARGGLKKELAQALRTGRTQRKPHGRVPSNARHIPDKVMISERPPEVADRAVPGHWEGDLIMGTRNQSAIGTLVERTTRHVMLLHLPKARDLEGVRDAMIEAINSLPEVMRRSVTWDQGIEMKLHAQITLATDVAIYFCDPRSPWQRGSNENTNGLLRQYFPKGTDLSVHSPEHLRAVADELNGRPRQTLEWRSPARAFNELVASAA